MGKKWQALLLGQKPAAMVTVKHKHANNAAVFAFDAFRKVLIDAKMVQWLLKQEQEKKKTDKW